VIPAISSDFPALYEKPLGKMPQGFSGSSLIERLAQVYGKPWQKDIDEGNAKVVIR
jgi:hypothetical protein